ncbi:MAG: peptidylprolyl isomerase [Saprospiraceae bacterium]|nr:peptidylprolyl isomerase [Saprospiraceae bacterium]
MALIGKIRKNMWLVIILLAIALAGFILMDITSSSNRGGFGSQTTIGKVAGQKIDYLDFQRAENALFSGSGDVYGRRNVLWNYFVDKAIIDEVATDNGIGVGKDELNELEFGINLSPVVQNNFRNPQTGMVDREQLNQFKQTIDEGNELNPQFAAFWNEQRKQIITTQKQTKLNNLVSKAIYTPTWQADFMDKIANETADIEYVRITLDKIEDSEVKLTDEDYSKYINENALKYTNKEEVRNLNYMVFDVVASTEDSIKYKDEIAALITEFANTDNDSLFVTSNNGFYATAYAKQDDLTGPLKDTINSMSVGSIYGPYIDNTLYVAAKLTGKRVVPDSAKAGHIFRSVQEGDAVMLEEAKKYIDSLKTLITSGKAKFEDLARDNSQDPGSAEKGGDLGTFAPGTMLKSFNDAIFETGKDGGLYSVETQSGMHLIKVNKLIYDSNEPKYKLAYLTTPIVPSQETQDKALDKVLSLLETNKTIESLTKLASEDLELKSVGGLKKNDYSFADLGSNQTSRDIVRWAFDSKTKTGAVSPVAYTYTDEVNYVDSKYVIVGLKSVDKAGPATVESLRSTIEPLVRNEKKAEMIKSKISGSNLESIASAFGLEVSTAADVSFGRGFIPDVGQEPKVIGKIFAQAEGAVTEPITGNSGVYVVKTISKKSNPSQGGAMIQKMQANSTARNQVNSKLMESIRKKHKVDDNRATFF